MTGHVRVLIFVVAPGEDPEAVIDAYHTISSNLRGTQGLLGNELLRSAGTDPEFVVMSEWEDLSAFRTWEASSSHQAVTSPLRPYQDRRRTPPFGIYEVLSAY